FMQIGSFDLPCNCSTRLEHGNPDTPGRQRPLELPTNVIVSARNPPIEGSAPSPPRAASHFHTARHA
ncbi:hypothetical protein, partial [Burkholderia stagnalis]|uniref:hypothetical protein n=1 Tax=Burkholderia stagnalis TaxID=1503054 RepID=UPI001E47BE99